MKFEDVVGRFLNGGTVYCTKGSGERVPFTISKNEYIMSVDMISYWEMEEYRNIQCEFWRLVPGDNFIYEEKKYIAMDAFGHKTWQRKGGNKNFNSVDLETGVPKCFNRNAVVEIKDD